ARIARAREIERVLLLRKIFLSDSQRLVLKREVQIRSHDGHGEHQACLCKLGASRVDANVRGPRGLRPATPEVERGGESESEPRLGLGGAAERRRKEIVLGIALRRRREIERALELPIPCDAERLRTGLVDTGLRDLQGRAAGKRSIDEVIEL